MKSLSSDPKTFKHKTEDENATKNKIKYIRLYLTP